jgi:hypothetical protein
MSRALCTTGDRERGTLSRAILLGAASASLLLKRHSESFLFLLVVLLYQWLTTPTLCSFLWQMPQMDSLTKVGQSSQKSFASDIVQTANTEFQLGSPARALSFYT